MMPTAMDLEIGVDIAATVPCDCVLAKKFKKTEPGPRVARLDDCFGTPTIREYLLGEFRNVTASAVPCIRRRDEPGANSVSSASGMARCGMDVRRSCDGVLECCRHEQKATSAGVTSLLSIDGRGSNMAIEPC
jgi:hypothetical protein